MVTLGCSKNVYDSEVLMGQLKAGGKEVVHEKEGNIVVINTCGFINNAKEESINTILDYVQQKEAGKGENIISRKKKTKTYGLAFSQRSLGRVGRFGSQPCPTNGPTATR